MISPSHCLQIMDASLHNHYHVYRLERFAPTSLHAKNQTNDQRWNDDQPPRLFLRMIPDILHYYCVFDSFQKVVFCLACYTEKVNLQIFVMI